MPRVSIKRNEYAKKDFTAFLVGWMSVNEITRTDLAEALGISRSSLTYKIKNAAFTFEDLYKAFTYMDVPDTEIARLMKAKH